MTKFRFHEILTPRQKIDIVIEDSTTIYIFFYNLGASILHYKTNKAFVRTQKLRRIVLEAYLKNVYIQHLAQPLAKHLSTKPLIQPAMQHYTYLTSQPLPQHIKQALTQTQHLDQPLSNRATDYHFRNSGWSKLKIRAIFGPL